MKYKKLFIFMVSVCFGLAYYIFDNALSFGLCVESDYACRSTYTDLQDVVSLAPYLLAMSLVVSFLPTKFFEKWWNFAVWALPLSVFLFVGVYESWFFTQSGGSDLLAGLVENVATKLIYIFFVLGSLIQLFRAYRSDRKVVKK